MAGGGSRRAGAAEEPRIGSGNVFAALETLKKKKKKPAMATAQWEMQVRQFITSTRRCAKKRSR